MSLSQICYTEWVGSGAGKKPGEKEGMVLHYGGRPYLSLPSPARWRSGKDRFDRPTSQRSRDGIIFSHFFVLTNAECTAWSMVSLFSLLLRLEGFLGLVLLLIVHKILFWLISILFSWGKFKFI